MTNREFLHATPKQKTVMIMDGMEYIAWKLEKLTAEMKVLNQWINQVPDLCTRGEMTIDMAVMYSHVQLLDSRDKITEQIVRYSQETKKLETFLNNQLV